MPKRADYRIEYNRVKGEYELVHTPFSFPLTSTATLQTWLQMVSTVSFCSATQETMTLRRETKQRGGEYWYAYKRQGATVKKKYLGETSKITLDLLLKTARLFVEPSTSPPPPPPSPPPQKPTLIFEKTLQSALKIYGFLSVPSRKDLIGRYRELSKQYHPDRGGIHQDMVAVNLAYEYLKPFCNPT